MGGGKGHKEYSCKRKCFILLYFDILIICLLIGKEPTANFGNYRNLQIR